MSPTGPAPLAWVLVLSVSALGAPDAGAARIQDDQNAFHGYVMQAPLAQYPSLKVLKTWSAEFVKEIGEYENPGEVLTVNGVAFLRVRYRFADQQLESIQLVYEGRANRDKLLQWLEGQYGKVTPQERKIANEVDWVGERMVISLSYNFGTKEGSLWFISPALQHLIHDSTASMPD